MFTKQRHFVARISGQRFGFNMDGNRFVYVCVIALRHHGSVSGYINRQKRPSFANLFRILFLQIKTKVRLMPIAKT